MTYTKEKTKIVVIGDTHIGSIYGLAPLTSIPKDRSNAFLQWIYQCWSKFTLKHKNPDYLITIGDLADGSQVKTLGVDALCTDTDEQVNMAKELFSMLLPDKKTIIYGINGSGYHGGEAQGTCIDRRIIEAISGEFKGNLFEFDISNERIQVSHGGTGSMTNPSSYILREINLAKMDALKRKSKAPTILLRGHQHRFFTVQDDLGIYGVINGCWQYRTPFMIKMSANVTPNFGAIIIELEDDVAKIYREEYALPEEVRQSMNGYEVLLSKKEFSQKIANHKLLRESLRERKY